MLAEIGRLKMELAKKEQNERIGGIVEDLINPSEAKLVQAVLIAVDRAEKAEAEVAKLKQEARECCGEELAERAKKAEDRIDILERKQLAKLKAQYPQEGRP